MDAREAIFSLTGVNQGVDVAFGSSMHGPASIPSFVGREHEIAVIEAFVEEARNGRGGLLVLEAEAGGGKTSLIRHALSRATASSKITVFAGEGDPNDPRALRCLGDALGCRVTSADPVRAKIAELLRSSSADRREGMTAAVQELIVDVIERSALAQTVLLVVDDMHWVDDTSLAAIGSLTRRLRGLNVGVLAATRPSSKIHAALGPFEPVFLEIRPLGDDDLITLSTSVTGTVPTVGEIEALSAVRSNPFLVSMLSSVGVKRSETVGDAKGIGRDAFRRLAASLDPTLRSFLELAAVAGREVDVEVLAEASDERVAAAVTMARDGVQCGWLVADGESIRFRHDLFLEALTASVATDRMDRLHLRIGRALARLGHAPGRAGFHLNAASHLLVSADISALLAVLDGLSFDDDLALALAQRSFDLDCTNQQTVLALMKSLASRHRHVEAVRLATPWINDSERGETQATGRIRLAAAASYVTTKGSDAAIELLHDGLENHDLGDSLRADYLNALARLHWYRRDAEAVRLAAAEALIATRSAHSIDGEIHALCSLSEAASLLGNVDEALMNAEAAVALSARLRGTETASPELALGTALATSGRMLEGLKVLTRSLHKAERAGDPAAMALAQVTMHGTRFHIGDWDGYVADADAMSQIGAETGIRSGIVLPLGFAAVVATRRAHYGDVSALLARMRAENTKGDAHPSAILGTLLGELAETEASGRLEEACTKTAQFVELLASAGYSAQALISMDAARLAWEVGDQKVLDDMATLALQMLTRSRTSTRAAMSALCSALANHDLDALLSAAAGLTETERVWDSATALHMAGVAAKRKRHSVARSLLTDAARRYRALGAFRHASVASSGRGFAALHATNATNGAPSHTHVEAPRLTITEQRVLDLVTMGKANGDIGSELFISKRTVESHVAALYRKLDVTTRVALARVGSRPSADAVGAERR